MHLQGDAGSGWRRRGKNIEVAFGYGGNDIGVCVCVCETFSTRT